MPRGANPFVYRYRPEDDPTTVATQFGITPSQLIQANPGGFPFSTGQTINVPRNNTPFQYGAPVFNTPPTAMFQNPPANLGALNTGVQQYANPAAVGPFPQNYQQAQKLIRQGVPTSAAQQITGTTSQQASQSLLPTGKEVDYAFRAQGAAVFGPAYASVMARLATNPEEFNNLTKTQQDAIEKMMTNAQGGGAGNTDFKNTQGYLANADKPFLEQTTYINGKPMKIKDAVRRGLLDLKTGRRFKQPMKRNRKGKLVSAEQAAPVSVPVQEENGVLQGIGVVNFGASSG